MSEELIARLRSSAAVMGMLPEDPGYNGSRLIIDDVEAARIAKDIGDALIALQASVPSETGKTLGETPRTDTAIKQARSDHGDMWGTAVAAHARTLERELAEANLKIAGLIVKGIRASDPYLIAKAASAEEGETAALARAEAAESALADARRDAERLSAELAEAWEAAVDWGGYASEYFKAKHDYAGDVAKFETAKAANAARKESQ